MEVACQTHVGRIRKHNEDSLHSDPQNGFAILADGMGGLNAGEVASELAVDTLRIKLQAHVERQDSEEQKFSASRSFVKSAIETTSDLVYQTSKTRAECKGMGTTVVACLFTASDVIVGHIGDSRLYRLRQDGFEQLTKDHSLVQRLVDEGMYTKAQARTAKQKNVLTRALGVDNAVEADVSEFKSLQGDVYLMCSDGLSDMVTDGEIAAVVQEYSDNLSVAADHLIDMANTKGGKDNISVVLVKLL
jgi:serine/threonine protein phosphatase PrpC